jgi:hypothetical protein
MQGLTVNARRATGTVHANGHFRAVQSVVPRRETTDSGRSGITPADLMPCQMPRGQSPR